MMLGVAAVSLASVSVVLSFLAYRRSGRAVSQPHAEQQRRRSERAAATLLLHHEGRISRLEYAYLAGRLNRRLSLSEASSRAEATNGAV